jgi:alcohol dehydrogenase
VITTPLLDTATTPLLFKVVQSGKVRAGRLATHRLALADVMKAYDTFGTAARVGALKVMLTSTP